MNDWLRVTAIGGGDYECRMTILKTDGTTITVTRPWHHHWTDGWDWKTIIRQDRKSTRLNSSHII